MINVAYILQKDSFKEALNNTDTTPLIFAGDFNAPSHLDWVESTRPLHCGRKFKWPATEMLEEMGLIDSFRKLHPDPLKEPAITWSTVNKYIKDWGYTIPTPQDRIDLILYKGKGLKPIRSGRYAGTEGLNYIPYAYQNDYPSDHWAFVTDFEVV